MLDGERSLGAEDPAARAAGVLLCDGGVSLDGQGCHMEYTLTAGTVYDGGCSMYTEAARWIAYHMQMVGVGGAGGFVNKGRCEGGKAAVEVLTGPWSRSEGQSRDTRAVPVSMGSNDGKSVMLGGGVVCVVSAACLARFSPASVVPSKLKMDGSLRLGWKWQEWRKHARSKLLASRPSFTTTIHSELIFTCSSSGTVSYAVAG